MAFFAVLREGLETAIFMLAAFQNSTDPWATGLGAMLGVIVAVALGYAIYKGGIRINLSRFFRITGFVLVLVAAGLLASAVHSLAEAGVVTQLQSSAFDLHWLVDPGSVRAALLTGMLGLQQCPPSPRCSLGCSTPSRWALTCCGRSGPAGRPNRWPSPATSAA